MIKFFVDQASHQLVLGMEEHKVDREKGAMNSLKISLLKNQTRIIFLLNMSCCLPCKLCGKFYLV